MLDKIVKRDGRKVKFNSVNIHVAALSAITSVESTRSNKECELLAHDIDLAVREKLHAKYNNSPDYPNVEEVQDLVQQELFNAGLVEEAKHFIEYRETRTAERERKTELVKTYNQMLTSKATDMNLMRENANIDGNSVMGTMLRIGSEANKSYVDKYILKPEWSYAHSNGDFHIHDKDFYELTFNCFQIPLSKLFKHGFSTGHGFLRRPNSIHTAAELAAIAIQSEQNDQFGGTSIATFEDDLAPFVATSFAKYVRDLMQTTLKTDNSFNEITKMIDELYSKYNTVLSDEILHIIGKYLQDNYPLSANDIDYIINTAIRKTDDETYQGMEAFIHNMNSLHSRCLPKDEKVLTLNVKKTHDLDNMSDIEKVAFKDLLEKLYETNTIEEIACEINVSLKVMCNIFKKLNIHTRDRKETSEFMKQRWLNEYGVDNPAKCENIKEKIKHTQFQKYGKFAFNTNKQRETMIERYGVDNPMKSDVCKRHMRENNLEKYGYEHTFQVPDFKEKARKTNLLKYGDVNPLGGNSILRANIDYHLTEEHKRKIRDTLTRKYGGIGSGSDYIKHKIEETCMKRYGSKTYPCFADAKNIKNSKGENELASKIKEKFDLIILRNVKNLMKEISFHEIDIYLPEIKLGIEYNGNYWHDKDRYLNEVTNNIFECKERMKDYYAIQNGFDLIQIFEDDYLHDKENVLNFIYAEIEKKLEVLSND